MTISRYVLVDRNGNEGDHEFEWYGDAEHAAGDDHAVIERIYEYSESGLVWTPDGSNVWPPESRRQSAYRSACARRKARGEG